MEVTLRRLANAVQLVGAAPSVAHLQLERTRPQVAVLALRLEDGSSPRENVERLREAGAQVLMHCDGHHVPLMAEAVGAGASGIVFKHQPVREFLEAVRTTALGRSYMSVELAAMLQESRVSRPQLTTREVEVLSLLYRGLVSKQVARRLELAESTVKEHLKRIRAKYAALGRPAKTRVELLQRAAEDGYVGPDDLRPLPPMPGDAPQSSAIRRIGGNGSAPVTSDRGPSAT